MTFKQELALLLRKYTETVAKTAKTPDFILAQYMIDCLEAFGTAALASANWHEQDQASLAEQKAAFDGPLKNRVDQALAAHAARQEVRSEKPLFDMGKPLAFEVDSAPERAVDAGKFPGEGRLRSGRPNFERAQDTLNEAELNKLNLLGGASPSKGFNPFNWEVPVIMNGRYMVGRHEMTFDDLCKLAGFKSHPCVQINYIDRLGNYRRIAPGDTLTVKTDGAMLTAAFIDERDQVRRTEAA